MGKQLLVFFLALLIISNVFAESHTVNLVVGYKVVNFDGKERKAIVVNNQIPAPTLHFKEGDDVTINVHNQLDQETAIHWHGMLVPWQMDGVLGISQQGIPPGGIFHYQFTLHQAGTYWYHAHAGLQEQQGLYGAFLIDPPQPPSYHYTKDYVVVLSDWSDTDPEQILANLKKEGDYYSPRFPLQPSLAKFIHDYRKASAVERVQLIDDYKMMQQMRMSIYDISDVAYDAFLLNGQPKTSPWTAPVDVGDVVRLRFIGASGGTIYHVKIPGTIMQMVHAEGNDVEPIPIEDFTIAPGETYDVLVKIEKNDPYIIYAESTDTAGAAYGALVSSSHNAVNYQAVSPFPEPLPVTREMMSMMMGKMNHGVLPMSKHTTRMSQGSSMDMGSPHDMAGEKSHDTMPMQASPSSDPKHMNKTSSHEMGPMSNMSADHLEMPGSKDTSPGTKMDHDMSLNHPMDMSMPTEPTHIGDILSPPNAAYMTSTGTKYQNLIAAVKTNDPTIPIAGVIKMELFGYMDRFIWFINGVPEYNAKPIVFDPGKRYRIIFTNTSMMHHPMHIHGHWFILRKGNEAYDPLLHTIDVPPGATVTADIDAEASGQWFFHCHMLYHMMTGMSRVFQYSTLIEITKGEAKPQNSVEQTPYHNRPIVREDEVRPIDVSLVNHPMAHPAGFWGATFLDIGADPFNNSQRLSYKGLYGPDYNKLELFINDAEIKKGTVENADIDIFYWHLLDQFWAIKGGLNYFNRPATTPYWQPGIGLEGLMPYFIETDIRGYFYSGSAKLDIELSRDTQITNNFFVRTGVRSILASKTVTHAGIGNGLNQMRYIVRPYYRLMPGLNLFAEFEHEQDYGSFKNIQRHHGDSTVQNTLIFGFAVVL